MLEPIETRRRGLLSYPFVWLTLSVVGLIVAIFAEGTIQSAIARHTHPALALWPIVVAFTLASWWLYSGVLHRAGVEGKSDLYLVMGLWLAFLVASTVAISSLLCNIDRGKQKRTMADMRALSSQIEAYLALHPEGADAATMRDVNALINSTLSGRDGWNEPFTVRWHGRHYLIRSLGKDAAPDSGDAVNYVPGETISLDDDIVLEDGHFTRYPAGMQP
ncbi:MAG TPA: hypothetical protein VFV19_10660 [Candidatus Polarisedimenticolaceae bacterium]|nr:hypothetical protein [Candidatus Polarisedimenticolaceae bacterium]